MNIDKIKNYNQKMLALIATAAVAFAVIGLFSFIFFMLTDVFRIFDQSVDYQTDGLPSEEMVFDDSEAKMPELFVSYQFPHLIDTSKQIFVIPITQQTEDEIRDDFARKITFSGLGSYDSYDYSYNATFINLLIYNATTNQHKKLFNQPIIIGEYRPVYFKDDILVVFEAANEDSDKNGMINLNDNTSLFIYSINNEILKQAKMSEKKVLHYQLIPKSKDLIIRFGTNPNKRLKDKTSFDPGILCKYSYENDQLIQINNEKLNVELKNIAEGDKN